ncbi:MAG: hypothetical protein ABW352_23995 [Polyangiales bacterium]
MRATLIVVLGLLLPGCAGARGALTFDGLQYPVSSSSYLYAPDDRPVTHGELQQVGSISTQTRVWSLFWSAIPLTPTRELSGPLNEQIASAGGEGVTDLNVRSQNCGTNYIPFISWLPFYPGCALVTISGSVVKLPAPRVLEVAVLGSASERNADHGKTTGDVAHPSQRKPRAGSGRRR